MKRVALIVLACCGLLFGISWWYGRQAGPTDAQALLVCQRFAAERYQLPATTTHSGHGAATISRSGGVFTVAGWSDTPVQRYRWSCRVRSSGGDRWELLSIS